MRERGRIGFGSFIARSQWVRWLVITAVTVVSGVGSARAGLPVPWLIGPLMGNVCIAIAVRKWLQEKPARAAGEAGSESHRRESTRRDAQRVGHRGHRPEDAAAGWEVPSSLRWAALLIMGLAVGTSFSRESLGVVGERLPILVLLVVATTVLSLLNGLALVRWGGLDRGTGLMGCIPGGVSNVLALSAQMGLDVRMVAVLQYLRILLAVTATPLIAAGLAAREGAQAAAEGSQAGASALAGAVRRDGSAVSETVSAVSETVSSVSGTASAVSGTGGVLPIPSWLGPGWPSEVESYVLLVAAGTAGVWLAKRIRLPAGLFLGPCFCIVIGSVVLDIPSSMPKVLFNGALAVLGAWIGLQFDLAFLRRVGRTALLSFLLLLGLMGATALFAFAFSSLTGVSFLSAFLGSVPGGVEVMIATSMELGADTPLVAAMQVLRLFGMLLFAPWMAVYLGKQNGKRVDNGTGDGVRVESTGA